MAVTLTEFSELSALEETCVIIDAYAFGILGIFAAIYYLISVKNQLNQHQKNKYYQYATYCAIASFICSILAFSLKLFFGNDILIPHNKFVSKKMSFVSIVDTLIIFVFAIEGLCVYYGFLFHSQSLTDKTLSNFVRFLMVGTAVVVAAECIIYIFDDALIYTPKEIGIAPTYNFHIAMYLGHEDAGLVPYVLFVVLAVDIIYFIYILYLYINILKQVDEERRDSINVNVGDLNDVRTQGIKGISLIIFTRIVFCICVLIIGLNLEIKYLFANIVVLSDNLCLFLILKSKKNQWLYNITCGRFCNNCWIKIVYGMKYRAVYQHDSDEDDSDSD